MRRSKTNKVLRRLFQLQCFSLPQYLLTTRPHVAPGDQWLLGILQAIAARQQAMAERLAHLVLSHRESLTGISFPMTYAETHDLELRSLFNRILDVQRVVVKEIREAVAELAADPQARKLARKMLRQEMDHLTLIAALCARWAAEPRTSSSGSQLEAAAVTSGTTAIDDERAVTNGDNPGADWDERTTREYLGDQLRVADLIESLA